MHYRPDTVMLGNVEFDHEDIYRGDLEQIDRVGLPAIDRPGPACAAL